MYFRQSGAGQNLSIGASSQASTAVPQNIFRAQLSALGNCHVAIGRAAVATDQLLKASDPPTIIHVAYGETINVIQDAAATGNLNVIWLTA